MKVRLPVECLDCESEDLAIVAKKRMLVKCTKCCEFKLCSKFGFRRVSENVDNNSVWWPLAKQRKPCVSGKAKEATAGCSAAHHGEFRWRKGICICPDHEEAAQLDLKPAANVASYNSTTNSNHGIIIYPSLFEFVSFLLPFLAICYLCYHLKSTLPLYAGATSSSLLLSTELVPAIIKALYHCNTTWSLPTLLSTINFPWQLLLEPMLWVGLILITIFHPTFVHFEQPKLPHATRHAIENGNPSASERR